MTGSSRASSLPKLLAAFAVAVLVTLSTVSVAHAARDEDPWNPNRWGPGAIAGAVGGLASGFLIISIYTVIAKEIKGYKDEIKISTKDIKESANNARKLTDALSRNEDKVKLLTQALDENEDNLRTFKESLVEEILNKIKQN